MLESLDWKLVAVVLGFLSNLAFLPYIRDVLAGRTQPHAYTWLIWILTQGTAVAGILHGGGGWGALGLAFGLVLVTIVFLLSFRYGTKNVTRGDALVLAAALVAIGIWWQLDQPVLAVLMVSAIDALGYIPTFRKAYEEPWSETASSWGVFAAGNAVSLFGLASYNLLTMSYLATILIANVLLTAFLLVRRQSVPPPAA